MEAPDYQTYELRKQVAADSIRLKKYFATDPTRFDEFLVVYIKNGFDTAEALIDCGAATDRKTADRYALILQHDAYLRAKVKKLLRLSITNTAEEEIVLFIRELRKIAFRKTATMLDDEGKVLPLNEIPSSILDTVAQVSVENKEEITMSRGGEKTVTKQYVLLKFESKLKALELYGKILGIAGSKETDADRRLREKEANDERGAASRIMNLQKKISSIDNSLREVLEENAALLIQDAEIVEADEYVNKSV